MTRRRARRQQETGGEMTDGDNETEMEERWRKPEEAASRKRCQSALSEETQPEL